MAAEDLETIRRALAEHVAGEILLCKEPLSDHEDLFAAGFDSLSLSRVLVFVEKRFGLMIPDEDVVVDEVSTIDKLARFVALRLRPGAK